VTGPPGTRERRDGQAREMLHEETCHVGSLLCAGARGSGGEYLTSPGRINRIAAPRTPRAPPIAPGPADGTAIATLNGATPPQERDAELLR